MEQTSQQPQTALIEQQKKITVTGVESVDAFSDRQISLTLENGTASISGDGLTIVSFSKTSGAFTAVGKVSRIRFHARGEKLSKRLFG